MLTPTDSSGTFIVYDGDCPFCRGYVSLMKLREAVGKVNLVDARVGGSPVVDMLNAKGYDLNEGMAVIFGDKVYYGNDAVVFISSMTNSLPLTSKLLAILLRNKSRAALIYPIMKLGRWVTLRVLGIPCLPQGAGRKPRREGLVD